MGEVIMVRLNDQWTLRFDGDVIEKFATPTLRAAERYLVRATTVVFQDAELRITRPDGQSMLIVGAIDDCVRDEVELLVGQLRIAARA